MSLDHASSEAASAAGRAPGGSWPAGSGAPADGRLARSARTRRAIVDALRALHHEGDLRPTGPRLAERAGVSLRTIWQHFEDLESLFVAAGERDLEIAQGYTVVIDAGLPRAERVRLLIDQRVRLFEAMAPVWRAGRLQEPFSAQIRSNRDRLVTLGRRQLEGAFAPELRQVDPEERTGLLNALQVAVSWSTWEALRTDLGLDVAAGRTALTTLVSRVMVVP